VKGRGCQSILELSLKNEIVIHDCLISQLDHELTCGKQHERNIETRLARHIMKSERQSEQVNALTGEVRSLDEAL